MPIRYNRKKIIPAPFVGITKNYDRAEDGNHVGSTFAVVLHGTILPCKGSPTSSGTFWTTDGYPVDESISSDSILTSVLKKQAALRSLFATEGQLFEIEPFDGTPAVSGYPRVVGMEFAEGPWHTKADYTVTLEFDELYGFMGQEDAAVSGDFFLDSIGNKLYLKQTNEAWDLEFNETAEGPSSAHTFRLTHRISALGKQTYGPNGLVSEPWKHARRWVTPRLGLNSSFVSSTSGLNLPGYYQGFNHVRTENTDKMQGSYGVTETWIISSGNVFEDFNVSVVTGIEDPHTKVTIEGTVTGMDTRNTSFAITQTKYEAALAKFNTINPTTIYSRASSYSGLSSLNSSAISSTVGKNPNNGTITYNFVFDDRPSNCIAGALSESIQVTDKNATDVFAKIPVLGRAAGPILQDLNTVTESSRTVSIDVVVPITGVCTAAGILAARPQAAVAALISDFESNLTGSYSQVFKETDTENWQPKIGKYSRTVGWTYQTCS